MSDLLVHLQRLWPHGDQHIPGLIEGIAASADALALVMLGHENVVLYDASMSEWAVDPSLPMETG